MYIQHRGQAELIARLNFLVKERGMGLVTEEIGAGKSTTMRRFVASLDTNQYRVIYLVANPILGMKGLYRDLLTELGYQPPYTTSRMVESLRTAFADLITHKHRCPVVIIDEAHHLPADAFEQLRLLFSSEMDSHSLGTLLLVGHPELRATLRLSIYQSFAQRLSMRYHLGPLDLAATLAYIQHQFQIAGYKGQAVFTDEALSRVFDYTKGIPRQINRVCTMALMSGMIDSKNILDESTLRKVITDLDHNG